MGKQKGGAPGKGKFKKGKNSFKFKGKKNNPKFQKKRTPTFDVNARLVVRNLSFKTTEESLKSHFEPYGEIAQVTLLKRPNGDLVGCGFIQYETTDNAQQALNSTNSQPFLGRAIQVNWALPKNEFVIIRNENTHEPEIKDEIKTEIKTEIDTNDNFEETNKFSRHERPGPAHDNKNEDKGVKKNGKERPPKETKEQQVAHSKVLKKARLIIRNISFKVTEESLKKYFEPFGTVLEVTLLKKPNGDLVGCGFVQFENVQMATKAMLNTNAKAFLGRPIHVDWAVAKNKYMSYVTQKNDEAEYLKNDIKSEPESDDEDRKDNIKDESLDDGANIKEESGSEEEDEDDDASSKDSDEEDDENSENDDDASVVEEDPNKLKVSANDAEDGNTVFLKNVSYNVGSDDLKEFVSQFGEVSYALVCVDKLTEHSKGTAFVRFKSKEDADIFLSAGPDKMMLEGQALEPMPAIFRDRVKGTNSKTKKQPKDSRNLYLIKEGVILANSKAAIGVSASDMAKRLSLEQNKSQVLRNLNRFISRYRLTIHNIPPHYTDEHFRKVCMEMANVKPYGLKECRIMKHLKGPLDAAGKHMSKGYGFVMFNKHEDALSCLRRMNNNPSIFDKNNRPIVAFSIEDKAVINARKKRLEKSKIKNPLHRAFEGTTEDNSKKNNDRNFNTGKNKFGKPANSNNMKRKSQEIDVAESSSPNKKTKLEKKKWKSEQKLNKVGNTKEAGEGNKSNFKKNQNTGNATVNVNNQDEYTGETAKPGGSMRMRSKYHLRMQAAMHQESVKEQKRKQKMSKKFQKSGVNEKIKQPRQKQNTNKNTKTKKSTHQKDERSFTDLVNKYKSKLVGGTSDQKVKTKWYDG